jgi:hypothetical protein
MLPAPGRWGGAARRAEGCSLSIAKCGRLPAGSGEEDGWRLGRIIDPFAVEWEIGTPLGGWTPT